MTEHCGFTDDPIGRCRGLQYLHVCRIEVETLTGKQKLPDELTAADPAAMGENV